MRERALDPFLGGRVRKSAGRLRVDLDWMDPKTVAAVLVGAGARQFPIVPMTGQRALIVERTSTGG
jgi:hypothetical protein